MPLTGHSQKENLLSVHYAARGMAGVFFCLAMPNSTAGMPAAPLQASSVHVHGCAHKSHGGVNRRFSLLSAFHENLINHAWAR